MQGFTYVPYLQGFTCNFREIFKSAFKIYGIWPHIRNAVPLVWGSLRVAPISSHCMNFFQYCIQKICILTVRI